MSKMGSDLFAAIHIGSEQISMQIVQYQGLDDIKIIERVGCQVGLGEETFKTGKISFGAVVEVCELLKGYRRLLNEYGVRDYRVMATTAVREAQNQPYIVDQIKIKTGFDVEVVDMPQEIFFKYVALFRTVQEKGLVNEAGPVLFVDISSGGLGFTLYKGGNIAYQQNLHIGALRIKESFEKHQRESIHFHQALDEYIYSTIEPVEPELNQHKIKYLVLSGVETRLLLRMLGREQDDRLAFVSPEEFFDLYEQVKGLNIPQLIQKYGLTEQKAEMVLPTIVLYKQILSLSNVGEIVISNANFTDGLTILHIGEKTGDNWLSVIEAQVVSLAYTISRKYKYDPRHAESVEKTSLLLFDRMIRFHGLGRRERLLLKVAAIMHDIGKYVSLRRHYFYSYRLIISSDIIGFSEDERAIIANIAYYHSKGTPSDRDPNFAALTRAQRTLTAKLCAIIRLADAIDRSHRQKAAGCDATVRGNEMVITVNPTEDFSLEEWTFADKAHFFEDVFGIKAVLERRTR